MGRISVALGHPGWPLQPKGYGIGVEAVGDGLIMEKQSTYKELCERRKELYDAHVNHHTKMMDKWEVLARQRREENEGLWLAVVVLIASNALTGVLAVGLLLYVIGAMK